MSPKVAQHPSESTEIIQNKNSINSEAQNDVHYLLSKYVVQDINTTLEEKSKIITESLNKVKEVIDSSDSTINTVYDSVDESQKSLKSINSTVKGLEKEIKNITNHNIKQILEISTKSTDELTTLKNTVENNYKNQNNEFIQKTAELKDCISDSFQSIISQNNELISTTSLPLNEKLDNLSNQSVEHQSNLSKVEEQLVTLASKYDTNISNQTAIIRSLTSEQSEKIDEIITKVKGEIITEFNIKNEQYTKKIQTLIIALLTICAINLFGIIVLLINCLS